jgi:exopolyphosphatase/guanosine-5'-triphosphate,3'-diphosphate pyrophosphatase
MTLRWEWRTFGDGIPVTAGPLGSTAPERLAESDETYLLSAEGVDAVKLRDGLVDVKHLERVDDEGLELWHPVMKSPLPLSAADARAVLAALGVAEPAPRLAAYALGDLVGAGDAVRAVDVHKRRRHFTLEGCMAELTDVRAGDRATHTIAIESEDPALVIAAVRALGLEPLPNVSMPRGLKMLVGVVDPRS